MPVSEIKTIKTERFYRLFNTAKKQRLDFLITRRGSKKHWKGVWCYDEDVIGNFPRLDISDRLTSSRNHDGYESLTNLNHDIRIAINYGFKNLLKNIIIESCVVETTLTLSKGKDYNSSVTTVVTKKVPNRISLEKMINEAEADLIVRTLKD